MGDVPKKIFTWIFIKRGDVTWKIKFFTHFLQLLPEMAQNSFESFIISWFTTWMKWQESWQSSYVTGLANDSRLKTREDISLLSWNCVLLMLFFESELWSATFSLPSNEEKSWWWKKINLESNEKVFEWRKKAKNATRHEGEEDWNMDEKFS